MALGQNLNYLRLAAGWTLAAVGERVGTSAQTIHKLEKTDAKRSEYAGAIARLFGLPDVFWLTDLEITSGAQAEELLHLLRQPLRPEDIDRPFSTTWRLSELSAEMLPLPRDTGGEYFQEDEHTKNLHKKMSFLLSHHVQSTLESGVHPSQSEVSNVRAYLGDTARRIPLISYVQAGAMAEVCPTDFARIYDAYVVSDRDDLSPRTFALEIRGESMIAPPGSGGESFNEGDRIIVDCDVTPLPGDFVVAKNGPDGENGEHAATFKKYRPRGVDAQGREVFELVPLNPDFPTLYSDRQPIKIIGTVVEHRRYRKRR